MGKVGPEEGNDQPGEQMDAAAEASSVTSPRVTSTSRSFKSGFHIEGISRDESLANQEVQAAKTLKEKVYVTMEEPSFSGAAKVISVVMMTTLIVSTIGFVLEDEVSVYGFIGEDQGAKDALEIVESICIIIFTLDFLVRLVTCPNRKHFFQTFFNWVDLAAVLPWWLSLILGTLVDLSFLRAMRLVRMLRLLKFGRYSVLIQLVFGAMQESFVTLMILFALLLIVIIIFAAIIFLTESANNEQTTGDVRCFGTTLQSFWWAVVTVTTVGYGDCSAQTSWGKFVSALAMIVGLTFLALPITVVSNNFTQMMAQYEEDANALDTVDGDGDGVVTEPELQSFLQQKRKAGQLRRGVEPRAAALMAKYDTDHTGTLRMMEFAQLRDDVLIPEQVDPGPEIRSVKESIQSLEAEMRDIKGLLAKLVESKGITAEGLIAEPSKPKET